TARHAQSRTKPPRRIPSRMRFLIGRGDRIRTCDPLVPNQVLYQAEPLPDRGTAEVARNPRRVNSPRVTLPRPEPRVAERERTKRCGQALAGAARGGSRKRKRG